MLTRIFFLVAAVCFTFTYGAVFDPYSRRYNVCKDSMSTLLNKPSGSTSCTLIQGLNNLTTKAGFTSAESTTYTSWVSTIETTIINNAAISSSQAKFEMISAAFDKFSLEQNTLWSKVQYLNISTWGAVAHVSRITSEWNMQSSLELIVANSNKGNCKLFDLLLESCAGDSAKHSALSSFIDSDLKSIVMNSGTMTQTEMISAIYSKFQTKFFVTNPTWITYFYSLNLNGYFAFSQWNQVAVTYQRTTTITTTLSGSGMDCPFILAMNKTLSMTTYTNTQKGFIKNLMNYFIQQWSTVTTVEARLSLISMKFSESIDLSYSYFSCLNSIQIDGFGSWYDLIIYSCQKTTLPPSCGCATPTFGPDTTTAAITTAMPTTTEAMVETTTEAMMTTEGEMSTEMPTEMTTENMTEGTTEVTMEWSTTDSASEATSEVTWDASSFSPITFPSTMEGCSCSCEM